MAMTKPKAAQIEFVPGGGLAATNLQDTIEVMQGKLHEFVSAKDFGAVGDDSTDDRAALILAMRRSTELGKTLLIPDGVYACSDWMPLPSNLKMVFEPNAIWKLTQSTGSIGGFVIGGYDLDLNRVPFDNVEIHGIALDCNNIAGENGFNAVEANNVRLFNPKIYNTLHSTVRLGGRAFQFEDGAIRNTNIYSPYIQNCSIGINSQGAPTGDKFVRVSYYDVVMYDVDVPFNVDSQYLNPETNTLLTMGTFVQGVQLFNCGKITWPNNDGGLGGGIVCGDRGYGIKISGLRLVNESSYGGIGAIVRGMVYNISISDAQIQIPYAAALFDFNHVGFGSPSVGASGATVYTESITYTGNLDYVVKGGASNDRIGASRLAGVMIDDVAASLAGIVDTNAGTGTSGSSCYLELALSNQQFNSSGLRSLANIYTAGNSVGLCQPDYEEGPWSPTDASGAGIVFSVSGTPWYVRRGRLVTAMCSIVYPSTSDAGNAMIGGLPYVSANLSPMSGVGSIGYTDEPTLSSIYVIVGTNTAPLCTSSGLAVSNSTMSGKQVRVTFIYFA